MSGNEHIESLQTKLDSLKEEKNKLNIKFAKAAP